MKTTPQLLTLALWLAASGPVLAGCPPTASSYCVALPAGWSLLANHLAPMPLSDLLASAVSGDTVYRFGMQTSYTVFLFDGGWIPGDPSLGQGEGLLVGSVGARDLSIAGSSQAPVLPLNLAPGFQLLSRQEVGLGTFENIVGYSPDGCPGLELYRLKIPYPITGSGALNPTDPNAYIKYTYGGGAWSPATPVLNIGEAA